MRRLSLGLEKASEKMSLVGREGAKRAHPEGMYKIY